MDTKKFNERAFDDMLIRAINELFQEKVKEFDAIPNEKHEFSPEFEKRIEDMLNHRESAINQL